jgi:hypothetical protein
MGLGTGAICPSALAAPLAERQTQGAFIDEERRDVRFFATSARGIEDELAAELEGILFPLARFPAPGPEELYRGVQTIDWSQHLSAQGTLAVDFSSSESALSHTRFGAQKVKDAIVDQFRAVAGERPSVDLASPDLRVNVFVRRDEASLAIDLSGESLHRRGWRAQVGEAPLKENLTSLRSGRGSSTRPASGTGVAARRFLPSPARISTPGPSARRSKTGSAPACARRSTSRSGSWARRAPRATSQASSSLTRPTASGWARWRS